MKIFNTVLVLLLSSVIFAQVAIEKETPDPNTILDFNSGDSKGLVLPYVESVSITNIAVPGTWYFDANESKVMFLGEKTTDMSVKYFKDPSKEFDKTQAFYANYNEGVLATRQGTIWVNKERDGVGREEKQGWRERSRERGIGMEGERRRGLNQNLLLSKTGRHALLLLFFSFLCSLLCPLPQSPSSPHLPLPSNASLPLAPLFFLPSFLSPTYINLIPFNPYSLFYSCIPFLILSNSPPLFFSSLLTYSCFSLFYTC